MRRAQAVAQISLWAALLVAFFCFSIPEMFRRGVKGPITLAGDTPFHSSDSFFEFAGGPRGGSQRLIALFDLIPAERRILILNRQNEPTSSLLGWLTAYLAWPHPVEFVDQALIPDPRTVTTAEDLRSAGAIVFCRVPRPANLPSGERFGTALEVVPIATNPQ
jgi:hypothetical protein